MDYLPLVTNIADELGVILSRNFEVLTYTHPGEESRSKLSFVICNGNYRMFLRFDTYGHAGMVSVRTDLSKVEGEENHVCSMPISVIRVSYGRGPKIIAKAIASRLWASVVDTTDKAINRSKVILVEKVAKQNLISDILLCNNRAEILGDKVTSSGIYLRYKADAAYGKIQLRSDGYGSVDLSNVPLDTVKKILALL